MKLKKLSLKNYRNYEHFEYNFKQNKTLIIGKNAQGKTNILESVFYLCTLDSSRIKKDSELIKFEKEYANIFATIEKTNIEIQDSMINREIQALMGEFRQRINMQGGNFDQMLEKEGHEKVYAQMKEEAEKRIKTSLIIGKIAQEENVNVTPQDIQEKITELANIYRTSTENIVAEIQKNMNLLNSMNQQVVTEKVTKLLIDNAKVTYTK